MISVLKELLAVVFVFALVAFGVALMALRVVVGFYGFHLLLTGQFNEQFVIAALLLIMLSTNSLSYSKEKS